MLDEIPIPHGLPLSDIARAVETFVDANGLRVTQRGPLTTHVGAIFWHIKKGKDAGMLDVTLFNRERYVQIEIPKGKVGPWTAGALDGLGDAIRGQLAKPQSAS